MAAIQTGAIADIPNVSVGTLAQQEARSSDPGELFEEEAYYPIEEFYEQDPDEEVGTPG